MASLQSQTGRSQYLANLTQSSTDAPVATEVQNDFGAIFTWGYTAVGIYTLTASRPVFTAAKTRVQVMSAAGIVQAVLTSTTVITITTKSHAGADANGLLTGSAIDVEVSL